MKLIIMKFGTKEEHENMKSLIDTRKTADCETKLATKLDPTIRITNIYNLNEEKIINRNRNVTGNEPVPVNIVQRAETRRAFICLKKIDNKRNYKKSEKLDSNINNTGEKIILGDFDVRSVCFGKLENFPVKYSTI